MIAQPRPPRPRARRASSACPTRCSTRSGRRTSGGTARAGPASSAGDDDPDRRRVVAARRVRRGRAPHRRRRRAPSTLAERRSRQAVRPDLVDAASRRRREGLPRPRRRGSWDAVIDAEPALAVALSPAECDDGARARSAASSTSSRRTRSGTRRPWPSSPRRAASRARAADATRCARCAGPGWSHGFGRLGVSNAIWDKPGPLGAGEWERVRLHPYLTERMLQQSAALAPLGRDRRAAPRATRRLRLPARPHRRAISPAGADPRRRRRLPGDARAAPAPRRASSRRRPPPSCAPRCGPAGSTPTRSTPCSPPPATGSPRRRDGPAGLTAREVEVLRLRRPRAVEQGDRRAARRSPRRPRATTSSTSTPRSAPPTAPSASLFAMQHGLLATDS